MNIRPTLFIGLGSTGINIIQEFRVLMYEQFKKAGLPIFQYIGIETDQGCDGTDRRLPDRYSLESFENVQMIHTTVDNALSVTSKLDPNNKRLYLKEMDRWVDISILGDTFEIKGGAGNVRMYGRLALWMNWQKVKNVLLSAEGHLRDTSYAARAKDILMKQMPDKDERPTISGSYDIYIFGTLCGGTCGGMIYDMAFQVQKLFGLHDVYNLEPQDPRFYAILTMLDKTISNVAPQAPRAANCWASLLELDYYMDNRYAYDYTMPLDPDFGETTSKPFTTIQLVSRTNLFGMIFPGAPAAFNPAPINKMIALKVFNNVFQGLASAGAAAAVDGAAIVGRGAAGAMMNDEGHTRTMTSFGVAALWHPTYKNAQAFGNTVGAELLRQLIGTWDERQKGILDTMATATWKSIFEKGKNKLFGPAEAELDRAYAYYERSLGNLEYCHSNEDLQELAGVLSSDRFVARLSGEGDLLHVLKQPLGDFEDYLKDRLMNLVWRLFDEVGPLDDGADADDRNRIRNFEELKRFLQSLSGTIETFLGKQSASMPQPNIKVTAPEVEEPEDPPWWKPFSEKEPVDFERFRDELITGFKNKLKAFVQACKKAVVQPDILAWAQEFLDKEAKRVDRIIANITQAESLLKSDYEVDEKVSGAEFYNILEVSSRTQRGVKGAVDSLRRTLMDKLDPSIRKRLFLDVLGQWQPGDESGQEKRWSQLLLEDPAVLAGRFRAPYAQWALGRQETPDLPKLALDLFSDDPTPLAHLDKRSYPYVELGAVYQPMDVPNPINFLCGRGSIDDLAESLHRLDPTKPKLRSQHSPLENLVLLYREEPPFYIGDLATRDLFEMHYTNLSESGGKTLHTHKDTGFFVKGKFELQREVMARFRIMQALCGDELFSNPGPRSVFKYRDEQEGRTKRIQVYEGDEALDGGAFCTKLSRQEYDGARQAFNSAVVEKLAVMGREEVDRSWNEHLDDLDNDVHAGRMPRQEYDELCEEYDKLFDDAFGRPDPGGKVTPMRR